MYKRQVYGYINRSADWDPYRIPELSIERTDLTKLITGPNEKGEWVMETKKFDLKSGDNGFINFCVWVANELCLMGKSKTFRFTKLSNGTWITVSIYTILYSLCIPMIFMYTSTLFYAYLNVRTVIL